MACAVHDILTCKLLPCMYKVFLKNSAKSIEILKSSQHDSTLLGKISSERAGVAFLNLLEKALCLSAVT